MGDCPRIHAKAYVKFALKVKNTPGTYLTHSGFAELGRAAEGSTDPDLHDAAMKPGNKETKQETQARRPLRRVGAKAYSKGKEAQEERQEGRKVGGQVRESAPGAQTPQYRDRAGHRDEAVRLLAPGDGIRTVLRARLAQGRRPQTRPVKVAATQAAEEGPTGLPGGLIPFAACKAACGPFSADSTRRRFNRHVMVGRAGGACTRPPPTPRARHASGDARCCGLPLGIGRRREPARNAETRP